jgi:PRTRC genetic system protein F
MPNLKERPGSRALRTSSVDFRIGGIAGKPSFIFAPPAALTIPSIHPEVPVIAELPEANSVSFAKVLASEGILKPKHWTGNIQHSIGRAFNDLIKFKCDAQLAYTDNIAVSGFPGDRYQDSFDAVPFKEANGMDMDTPVGAIMIRADQECQWFDVSKMLNGLEEAQPGLGQYILSLIYHRSYTAGFGCLSPKMAWDEAEHFYWGCERWQDKEKELWREETQYMISQGKKAEADKFKLSDVEMFRPSDLKVPQWALRPKENARYKNFDPKDVRLKNATLYQMERARIVIEAAHKYRAAAYNTVSSNESDQLDMDKSSSGFCAPFAICWGSSHRDDGTAAVYDDVYKMHCETGEYHAINYARLLLWHDTAKMTQIVKDIRLLFEAQYWLEVLITSIGEQIKL